MRVSRFWHCVLSVGCFSLRHFPFGQFPLDVPLFPAPVSAHYAAQSEGNVHVRCQKLERISNVQRGKCPFSEWLKRSDMAFSRTQQCRDTAQSGNWRLTSVSVGKNLINQSALSNVPFYRFIHSGHLGLPLPSLRGATLLLTALARIDAFANRTTSSSDRRRLRVRYLVGYVRPPWGASDVPRQAAAVQRPSRAVGD